MLDVSTVLSRPFVTLPPPHSAPPHDYHEAFKRSVPQRSRGEDADGEHDLARSSALPGRMGRALGGGRPSLWTGRAGIASYWIVDLDTTTVTVFENTSGVYSIHSDGPTAHVTRPTSLHIDLPTLLTRR